MLHHARMPSPILNCNGAGHQLSTPGDTCTACKSFLNFIGEVAIIRIQVHPLFIYYCLLSSGTPLYSLLCAVSHCKKPQAFNLQTLYMFPRYSGLNFNGLINTTLHRPFTLGGAQGGHGYHWTCIHLMHTSVSMEDCRLQQVWQLIKPGDYSGVVALTLGARGQLPSGSMLSTWWVLKQFTWLLPTG